MVRSRIVSLTLALAGLGWAPEALLAGDPEAEIGILGGVLIPDKDLSGDSEVEPITGLRVGYLFSDHFGWFVDGTLAVVDTDGFGDAKSVTARVGIDWLIQPPTGPKQWFLSGGAGWLDVSPDDGPSFDRRLASLSFGQRIVLTDRMRVRWEARVDRTFGSDGVGGEDLINPQGLVSLSWRIGGKAADSDGDGISDRRDDCPDTPRGATVDERGCPKDSDGDGVWDGIDQCPDTPKGATVDARGCPKDSDGDGVWDGIDRCPDTPEGATVDARGCPKDSDGDGVWDGIDRCPDTPKGATVDARGCPKDADGDGVWDGIDQCPDTPKGATVDARGCPKDSDGDGVWDGIDQCPDTPKGTAVRPDGCPKAAPLFTEEKKTLVLEGVFFEFDSDRLTPESATTLDAVAQSLVDWPEVRIEIAGHTDSKGSDRYNLDLSKRRAESVRRYLADKGVRVDRMEASGFGESQPVADNRTDAGRAKNRRVEVKELR